MKWKRKKVKEGALTSITNQQKKKEKVSKKSTENNGQIIKKEKKKMPLDCQEGVCCRHDSNYKTDLLCFAMEQDEV